MESNSQDGHREPNNTIYFRLEVGPGRDGWYWCASNFRSNTYSHYDACLEDYISWTNKTAEDFIPSAATHGGV